MPGNNETWSAEGDRGLIFVTLALMLMGETGIMNCMGDAGNDDGDLPFGLI